MSAIPKVSAKKVISSYKTRIYPNAMQRQQIEKTFGAKRRVYNYFIETNLERMDLNEYTLPYKRESRVLTLLKERDAWLKEADKFALQNAIKDQDAAFAKWFAKQGGKPHWKSKKDDHQTYRTNYTNNNIELIAKRIKLPKLKWIRFAKSKEITGKILNVTISRKADKYYISINMESSIDVYPDTERSVGIDVGLKSLAVIKNDQGAVQTIEHPKWLEKSMRNLKKKQRQLSRKQHSRTKGDTTTKSKRYIKQQRTVNKIQQHIANQRKDFLHKLTTQLVRENQAVGIEDLAVSNMMKNSRLSRHIAQSGWRMFRTFISYKCEWHDRKVVVHDRYYPSSKTCTCGTINSALKLSDRLWQCRACGAVHDRDELAASNLNPCQKLPVDAGK